MSLTPSKKLIEKRCEGCNKVLGRVSLVVGEVEIKCGKCGQLNTFTAGEVKQPEVQVFAIKQLV